MNRGLYDRALAEAITGGREGGIPIGAVLSRGETILGSGRNRRMQHGDPTAHAEIEALRAAGTVPHYRDTTLYSTLTPCMLCSGAISFFRIPRVVIGQARTYDGKRSLEFLSNNGVEVLDLDDKESFELLSEFIVLNSEEWRRDNGEWSST